MVSRELLKQVKDLLADVYGDRLQGVILYGSETRRDAEEDSDIDFLVLLKGPVSFGKELRTIIHTLYPLQLEILRPIHALPVDINTYEAGEYSLYRNAKKEGIVA